MRQPGNGPSKTPEQDPNRVADPDSFSEAERDDELDQWARRMAVALDREYRRLYPDEETDAFWDEPLEQP